MLNWSGILTATVIINLLGLALSALGCVIAFHQRGGGNFRAFFKYVFPKDLVKCWSCYQDAGFIVLKRIFHPFVSATLLLLTSASCALLVYQLLATAFGDQAQNPMPAGLFLVLLILSVLIQDFFRFWSHRWMHRFGTLWDVHKVHHSAGFLTPLTNHRVHIIEEVLEQGVTGLSIGPLLAIAAFLTATPISTNALLGFDGYMLIDTLSFAMLRHSHIGLSYGTFERFLLSPKQHHLHHSADRRHWDKNFGFLFSCWDRMAGTICYSDPKMDIRIGIEKDEAQDYDSVLKLHLMPFLKIYRRLSSKIHRQLSGMRADRRPQTKEALNHPL